MNARDYFDRANTYYDQGKFDEAINDYSEAIRLKPDYADAFNNRGLAYFNQKKFDEAINNYNEAIRLKPDFSEAFNNRGIAYRQQKKFDKAINDYSEAIRLKPDYAVAFNNRGNGYLDQKKFDKAINDHNEAIRLKPNFAEAFNNRGNAYFNQKKFDEAIKDFSEAIRLKPDYADAFYNRGVAYENQKKFDEAIKDYDKAIQLDPTLRQNLDFVKHFNQSKLRDLHERFPIIYRRAKEFLSLRQRLSVCGNVEIPPDFLDNANTLELMNNPVMLRCGDNVDQESLATLQKNNCRSCPFCRAELNADDFDNRPPNKYLKGKIVEFVEQQEKIVEKTLEKKDEHKEEKPLAPSVKTEKEKMIDARLKIFGPSVNNLAASATTEAIGHTTATILQKS